MSGGKQRPPPPPAFMWRPALGTHPSWALHVPRAGTYLSPITCQAGGSGPADGRQGSGWGQGCPGSGNPRSPSSQTRSAKGRRRRVNSVPQYHQLLRFRGPKAAWSWRLPSGQQTGCAHRDRPSRAAETDRLGPASASILRNKPGNHVEGRRKNNGKSRPGVRSIDAFLTNAGLEDWLTPEGGSDLANSMVFTSDRSRLSNRQLCTTRPPHRWP